MSVGDLSDSVAMQLTSISDPSFMFEKASDREMAVVVLLPVEEGATFSFGYTLGEGLGFPSDSEPVQITYVDITRSDLGMPNIQVQDLSLVSPSSISVTIANVPGALSILFW